MELYSHLHLLHIYFSFRQSNKVGAGISGIKHIEPKVKMTLIFRTETTSVSNVLLLKTIQRSDIMKRDSDCRF